MTDAVARRFELDYKPILGRKDATNYEKELVADINTLLAEIRRLTATLRDATPALLRAAEIFSRRAAEPEHRTGWNWRQRYDRNRTDAATLRALAERER